MTNESNALTDVAARWLRVRAAGQISIGTPESGQLIALSQEAHSLSEATVPQRTVLERAESLFDTVTASPWSNDLFGERYEVCLLLSFVAWRHSAALGLDGDVQEWLRIADHLLEETFAAGEILESYLFLPSRAKSGSLESRFLGSASDIFHGLAILRRARGAEPVRVMEIARGLYRRVETFSLGNTSSNEMACFKGELATLTGVISKNIGRGEEAGEWLRRAKVHFMGNPGCAGQLLQIEVVLAILDRDKKRFIRAERRLKELEPEVRKLGMYRDSLLCRLTIGLIYAESGRDEEADEILETVFRDTEYGYFDIRSVAATNLATTSRSGVDPERAEQLLGESIRLAYSTGNPMMIGSASMGFGERALRRGSSEEAIRWLSISVDRYGGAESTSFLAYARIYLAEALLSVTRTEEALAQLILAIPGIENENMVPEGIHALKLMGVVSAQLSEERACVRELLFRLHERFG